MSVILETPDHPRSCGANLSTISTSSLTVGSSPLVRGQPVIFPPLSVRARIIPARAGPTPFAISVASSVADHPRSCGANLMFSSAFFISSGSSPLVRGQHGLSLFLTICPRIIPARAGPTCRIKSPCGVDTDHPRSCGANGLWCWWCFCCFGSSPLVRGQPTQHIGGKPSITDHPRSCGANLVKVKPPRKHAGSSPLVRGQQSDFTRKKRVESNKNI